MVLIDTAINNTIIAAHDRNTSRREVDIERNDLRLSCATSDSPIRKANCIVRKNLCAKGKDAFAESNSPTIRSMAELRNT